VILDTARLTLRPLAPGDLDPLASMYADPEVMRYIGTGGPRGREEAARYIDRQRAAYSERGFGEWAAVLRQSDDMVGLCGLIVWPDIDGAEELEVAYMFARHAWGRGLATEAGGAIRNWAERELGRRRLVSCIDPQHTASIHVAQKIGMRYEKDFLYEGAPMALYAWSAPDES
jgi:ribosomal-protein-alanine N-acetyltransferase